MNNSRPEKLVLNVPYHTQLNNDRDWNSGPWNECSYTCMAMFLRSLGFVGTGDGQFEDQIERLCEQIGNRRGEPLGMRDLLRERFSHPVYQYQFAYDFTWKEAEAQLIAGHPVILHTWLTGDGHLVLLIGWDDAAYNGAGAYLYHDPYGEWFPAGYDNSKSGESIPYSYSLSDRLIGTSGDMWAHYVVPHN